jgi:hypothetical protein
VQEKAKALELTKRINFHECGGRAQVFTVRRKADSDFNEKDEKRDAASKTFWQLLVRRYIWKICKQHSHWRVLTGRRCVVDLISAGRRQGGGLDVGRGGR